jgi:hypothetical protein
MVSFYFSTPDVFVTCLYIEKIMVIWMSCHMLRLFKIINGSGINSPVLFWKLQTPHMLAADQIHIFLLQSQQ